MSSTGVIVGCEGNVWSAVGDSKDCERHLRFASKPLVRSGQAAKFYIFRCQTCCNGHSCKTRRLWSGWVCNVGGLSRVGYSAIFQRKYDGILKWFFCSYCWPCSLQLELCLSWSSPPAPGMPRGLKTLLLLSSPHFGLESADHQEKHNDLHERRSNYNRNDHWIWKLKGPSYWNDLANWDFQVEKSI